MNRLHVGAFVVGVTLVLFAGACIVLRIPEARAVQTADGALTVTGLVRSSQNIEVSVDTSATLGTPLLGLVYRVEPSGIPLDAPLVLSFAKSAELGTTDATAVYEWHAELGMWVPLASVVANTSDVLAVEVMTLGDFALGTEPDVSMPTLLVAQDALREKAPVGTRGFRISTGYTVPGGVPIFWPDAQVFGGCGGRIGAGDKTEYSSLTKPLNILVNDVQTAVDVTLVGEWNIAGDHTPCPASLPLKIQHE